MIKPELLHYAKQNSKQVHTFSQSILPDHNLVIYSTTLGPDIAQMYPEWVNELPEKINFGSHPLKLKQVKEIIKDTEYLNFL